MANTWVVTDAAENILTSFRSSDFDVGDLAEKHAASLPLAVWDQTDNMKLVGVISERGLLVPPTPERVKARFDRLASMTLADLYPEGRHLYYEGDDEATFIADMKARGIEVTVTVEVPAEKLDEFYALDYPIGS